MATEKKSTGDCPVPKGILVIIGGKENKGQQPSSDVEQHNARKLEILKAFIKLIDKQDPVLEVCTSGSSEGDASFSEYRKAFEELGVKKINHIHHKTRKDVLDDDLAERVNQADAFYFAGGDQLLLTGLY